MKENLTFKQATVLNQPLKSNKLMEELGNGNFICMANNQVLSFDKSDTLRFILSNFGGFDKEEICAEYLYKAICNKRSSDCSISKVFSDTKYVKENSAKVIIDELQSKIKEFYRDIADAREHLHGEGESIDKFNWVEKVIYLRINQLSTVICVLKQLFLDVEDFDDEI